MGIELVFEIEFESDYHVGAGHGGGLVDSILLRDGDGLPVIRGSAIAGLLRDALWQLMQQGAVDGWGRCRASGLLEGKALSFCEPGPDACPICRLFGAPGRAKRWRIGSARPVEYLHPGSPKPGRAVGGTSVHRVRIDPRTRRAAPRALFNQEQGERSWKMAFALSTPSADDAAYEEAALLVAAARAIRGLGRARRRGLGSCRIHLQDRAAEKEWLEWFGSRWLERKPLETKKLDFPSLPVILPSGEPVRLRVIARAEEPLLLAQRAEAGNEFASVGSLPGTVLLGALAGLVASRYESRTDPAAKEAFVQLFLRGQLRFSALFPALEDAWKLRPSIPAPLDLLTCKALPGFSSLDHPHSVGGYSLSGEPPERCPDCAAKGQSTPLISLPGFVAVTASPRSFWPATQHEMHIAVDPLTGRVAGDALYGYVALQAGHYFLGEIWCADRAAWQALKAMAGLPEIGQAFTLHVGRASRRGYGRMSLVLEEVPAGAISPWHGLPLKKRVPGQRPQDELVMTLLTDAIVPDAWLRGRTGFDELWLGRLFCGAKVKIVRAFARPRVVDSFLGVVGLPRFREMALAAGSAVGLRFMDAPPPDFQNVLAQLECEGIGLRREEGYGQVVFNHPIYDLHSALAKSGVSVPSALRSKAEKDAAVVLSTRFLDKWSEGLSQKNLDVWSGDGFGAVARILREGAGGTAAVLIKRMGNKVFGRPETLLGRPLGGPPRKPKKLVRDTDAGRRRIITLLRILNAAFAEESNLASELRGKGLEKLADLAEDLHAMAAAMPADAAANLRRSAIEMLADRVGQGASEARLKGEGGK